jgi:hypothetical protein
MDITLVTNPKSSPGSLAAINVLDYSVDITTIVQGIDEVIARLEKIRAQLTGHTAPLKRGFPPTEAPRAQEGRRKGRGRMPKAQQARLAKVKRK